MKKTTAKTPLKFETDDYARQALAWACGTIKRFGGVIHMADDGFWDVLTPKGWKSAATWQEMCRMAESLQLGTFKPD
jgi:hypothetical protein